MSDTLSPLPSFTEGLAVITALEFRGQTYSLSDFLALVTLQSILRTLENK